MTDPVIRSATLDDLDTLETVENRMFETDRLSRRSLRRFITTARDTLLVAEREGRVVGYALVVFRRGTALARLYSIAILPEAGRGGLGRALLDRCEHEAAAHGCVLLRLEVRADNAAAIALYERAGYRQFGAYPDYYEDHQTALRYEKPLSPLAAEPPGRPPPHFEQTLDFTCGPACLLMALAWADPEFTPSRAAEVRLWREATTVFMTSGLGGSEPYGLAVTLARRGLRPELRLSHRGPYFLEGVRHPDKKEVMRLTQEEFRFEAERRKIPVGPALDAASLAAVLDEGAIAIVLVSGYRSFRKKTPHWLLVHGHDGRHVFVNDPWVEARELETPIAAANLPIPIDEFQRMARYGRDDLRAAVVVRPRENTRVADAA